MECDDQCHEKKKLIEEEKRIELQKKLELEAEKNRIELENYEKKFAKKKFRKKQEFVEEKSDNKNLIIAVSAVVIALIAVGCYFAFLHWECF